MFEEDEEDIFDYKECGCNDDCPEDCNGECGCKECRDKHMQSAFPEED